MAPAIALAFVAGMLVTLSRQLNGRLAIETSALGSSFWNHLVGLAATVLYALVAGNGWPDGVGGVPFFAWLGGALGVVFVAGGSWLIPRLGAAMTGGLLVAGQMISGVVMDLFRSHGASAGLQFAGVVLILAGVAISRRTPRQPSASQALAEPQGRKGAWHPALWPAAGSSAAMGKMRKVCLWRPSAIRVNTCALKLDR